MASSCVFWSILVLIQVTLLHSVCLSQPIIASGNETDRLALLELKASISGDPHGALHSWKDDIHFCNWRGVSCSLQRGRVIALDLEGLDLQGKLSPSIGNLSFLRYVRLPYNKFHGQIPPQIGLLVQLEYLDFYDNMLEGKIPLNLTRCLDLGYLDLGKNRLSGAIPLELHSLVKLKLLSLDSNNLTGKIPDSFGNMSSLEALYLLENKLVGNIPDEFGRLKSLTIFEIGTNNLSGSISLSIYNLSSLTTFSIPDNHFRGNIPSNLGLKFLNLEAFIINTNEFYGKIPKSMSNASQLQRIDLSRNNLVGHVPDSFGNLQDINRLSLSHNSLGDYSDNSMDFIQSLANCSKLEVLDLSVNKFGSVLPNSIGNLSRRMLHIYLGANKISGNIPATLQNLVNLIFLSMGDNLFTGDIPSSFGNLRNLQLLNLDSNALSGKIPTSIRNLTHISTLFLSNNKLEGNIPPSIASNHQKLKELDLSSNGLGGDIPKEIFNLCSIASLINFSQNSLTGSIPWEVGKLKHVNALDLSENHLSGEIPESIGDCESLEFLYLQGNSFRGTLPAKLASLKGLQHLDVSRNNLTGKIPKGLEKLHFLLFLNLSFNDLDGEVPESGFYHNTSMVSLVGNAKLCGGITRLQLPRCSLKESKNIWKNRGTLEMVIVAVCFTAILLLLLVFFVMYYWRKSQRKLSNESSSISFFSKVTFTELYKATNNFSPKTMIGSGSFSSVYKGILDKEENPVAIKVLNLKCKGANKSFVAECNALRNARHRNLVKILTCCSSTDYNGNDFKALVLEFMSNGSLENWLHSSVEIKIDPSKGLSLIKRLNIAIDVASAMYYLHEDCDEPIIHCDLKPSNVLLDKEMIAHISDFGLARLISNPTSFSEGQTSTIEVKGTIGYIAPEYSVGSEPSKTGDVYSYGILVLEMFTGKRPTDGMFKDDFNLHNFVKTALPERLVEIVDPKLLTQESYQQTAARRDYGNITGAEIHLEEENILIENPIQTSTHLRKCLLSVLEIGIACSEEFPNQRLMDIGDVTMELARIRANYMAGAQRGQRQRTRFSIGT